MSIKKIILPLLAATFAFSFTQAFALDTEPAPEKAPECTCENCPKCETCDGCLCAKCECEGCPRCTCENGLATCAKCEGCLCENCKCQSCGKCACEECDCEKVKTCKKCKGKCQCKSVEEASKEVEK